MPVSKNRRKKPKKQKKQKNQMTPKNFIEIFLGENEVPLTDELIDQLVKEKGMDREELIYLRDEGAKYSSKRKSFVFPLES